MGRLARENIVNKRLGQAGGSVLGGRKVYISGGSFVEEGFSHHASSNLRKSFSRLPNPKALIEDKMRGGRGGSKFTVERCRHPNGTVRMTASAVKVLDGVSTVS
jgi:hypothetical protein